MSTDKRVYEFRMRMHPVTTVCRSNERLWLNYSL